MLKICISEVKDRIIHSKVYCKRYCRRNSRNRADCCELFMESYDASGDRTNGFNGNLSLWNRIVVRCFVYESVFICFVIYTADFFLSVYICECSIDFVKTGDKQISSCDTSVFIKLFFHMLVVNIRKYRLSPIVIFDMTNIRSLEFREVFAEGVLLVAVTSLLYFWHVKKDEALS